jgi:tetratricopeptide (TPR) repeat protein
VKSSASVHEQGVKTKGQTMKLKTLLSALCLLLAGAAQAQSYEELIENSYRYLEKDDLPAAEESVKAAMRLEPANPANYVLLTNLGTIQRRMGKKEDALVSYTAALSRHPDNPTILENRASLYAEAGEVDKAIADYTLLLFQDLNHQDALYSRGILYLHQRDFIRAEQDFDRMLEVSGTTVYGRLGHAILEKMRGNYDESERIYNYLIQEMPQQRHLYEGRADLYFLMGKNGRALADINRVFAETGEPTAEMYLLRGKIKLALFERSSATEDFHRAKEMGYDPGIVDELLRMSK